MIINIDNLRLRTIVGIFEWEQKIEQDVVLNIEIEIDGSKAIENDDIEHTVDYKTLTKAIIEKVENTKFNLIEKIAGDVTNIIMQNGKVLKSKVRVDKPGALRFADSVSVTHTEVKNV